MFIYIYTYIESIHSVYGALICFLFLALAWLSARGDGVGQGMGWWGGVGGKVWGRRGTWEVPRSLGAAKTTYLLSG